MAKKKIKKDAAGRSKRRRPLDIMGAEKYPEFEFRWVAHKNLSDRGYMGYQPADKREFKDLGVGYNDYAKQTEEGPSYLTYRDVILCYRPKEIQEDRRKEKQEYCDKQTILNHAVPKEYIERYGSPEAGMAAINSAAPAGSPTAESPSGSARPPCWTAHW